ncbi:MAG: O-antigen ligase family protein [Proteobacteria bacterium]|nr:O-antigen ligase family protein [Pseudomonadota bacterium]
MQEAIKYGARRSLLDGDRYLVLLGVVLLGYAVVGRSFAYIGIPPLYVGELVFLAGFVVLFRSGAFVAALASLPGITLLVAMIWVLIRTIPFVGVYGIDALRDSVVVIYGGFAFIVIGLLLEDPGRIDTIIRYYNALIAAFPIITVGYLLTKFYPDDIPSLYGPNVPIVDMGASAVGSHLAGAAVFVLIGYRKVSRLWVAVWFGTLIMILASTRGATIAVLLPVTFAMIVLGRLRVMLTTLAAGLCIFGAVYGAEAVFTVYQEAKDSNDRPVSAHQIVENAMSIFGQAGEQTEGTKQWRLDWWHAIIDDTLYGPNFWTGRGFGLNLADADGFNAFDETLNRRAPLRSPHSVHMTMLARTGVPGLVVWLFLLGSWAAMLLKAMLVARIRGHRQWADLFLFAFCYPTAILINATFDVTLEGPVQGIWFWCLFGMGIGSVMVYRGQIADAARRANRP